MENINHYFEYLEELITEHKHLIIKDKYNYIDIIESEDHYNRTKSFLDNIEIRILELPTLEHQAQYAAFIINRINYNLIKLCKKYNIQPPYKEREHINDTYYWFVIDIGKFIDNIVYIFTIIEIDIVPLLETTIGYIPDFDYYDEDSESNNNEDSESNNKELANNQLNNESISSKKFTSTMTQAQLATMFRLFRDHGIIDIKTNDTQLGRVIQYIAGGGLKRTKDYLGGGYSSHINTTLSTKEQAETIQCILKKIIEKIEDEKQDIIN